MPQGQLYIRTHATKQLQSGATGLIEERPAHWTKQYAEEGGGWVDTYLRYGLSLSEKAMSQLMTPPPNKKPQGNTSATANGVAYPSSMIGKKDEKDFSLDIHFTAPDKATFLNRYDLFCSEVLDVGYFQLRFTVDGVPDGQGGREKRDRGVYHLLYQDCQQFEEFCMNMAKFTLSVKEPHPEIRDERKPTIL